MLQLWYNLPGLAVILSCTFSGSNTQSYSSGSQSYNNFYYPPPAPASTAIATVPAVTTTSQPASQAPVTNSNTAPGGAPSNPIFGTNGTVCDTRTAFAAIGCPCMLVNKTCADPNSLCTATSSTSGRKKRFAQRGRKGSPMGNAAKNQCVCKSGYEYNSNSNTCIITCAQQFCTAPADESAYLQGPYALTQTFLLFSGTCVLQYSEDYTNNKLKVLMAPKRIASYVGQSAFTGPVTLAYDTSDSSSNFVLNLVDQSGSLLKCPVDTTTTSVISCPTAATANGGTTQLSKATSASTQLDFGPLAPNPPNFAAEQYGVLPSNTEIALFSTDFSTQYAQSTGFLNGQNIITKITAIQIIMDQVLGENNALLAVYGTDVNGVAYLGYVTSNDLTFPAVSQPASIPPLTWVGQPKPLKSQFEEALVC